MTLSTVCKGWHLSATCLLLFAIFARTAHAAKPSSDAVEGVKAYVSIAWGKEPPASAKIKVPITVDPKCEGYLKWKQDFIATRDRVVSHLECTVRDDGLVGIAVSSTWVGKQTKLASVADSDAVRLKEAFMFQPQNDGGMVLMQYQRTDVTKHEKVLFQQAYEKALAALNNPGAPLGEKGMAALDTANLALRVGAFKESAEMFVRLEALGMRPDPKFKELETIAHAAATLLRLAPLSDDQKKLMTAYVTAAEQRRRGAGTGN